jgi:cbb3-type cytochrome oxidase subunit 3
MVMSLMVEQLWSSLPASPYFASFSHTALTSLILAFGGIVAFLMVWTEFTVIAQTSALTFMVAGTFKEIVTVMAAVLFLGEEFYAINAAGLAILVIGVFWFNYTKYRKAAAEQAATDVLERKDSSPDLNRSDGKTTPRAQVALSSAVHRSTSDNSTPRAATIAESAGPNRL